MVVSVPLARWTSEQTERNVNAYRTGIYLESLLDLFYEHIAICGKTVHGEYSAVGSRRRVNGCLISFKVEKIGRTSEILWGRSESGCCSPRSDGYHQR
jgi:hypothetical protein